jgi:hypothetical protein
MICAFFRRPRLTLHQPPIAATPENLVQKARNGLRRLVLSGFGFAAAADAGGGMGLATLAAGGAAVGGEIVDRLGRERAIRLLLNPDFTGWLRRLPNTSNPQAINRSLQSLRSAASRSPVMMGDVQSLERALIESGERQHRRITCRRGTKSVRRQLTILPNGIETGRRKHDKLPSGYYTQSKGFRNGR